MRGQGRRRAAPAELVVDILVQSGRWKAQRGVAQLLRRAIAAAAAMVPTRAGELAIVLTDDSAIRVLNRVWRHQDAPTNVLSFAGSQAAGAHPGAPHHVGDIVIAYETTAREAEAEDKPLSHHLTHLAVHGYLHLAGYDHETDAEAEVMEQTEISVLAQLKVANPYVARPAGR